MADTISHIRNALVTQLDRLTNDNLEGEQLKTEINRARAMSEISEQVLDAGRLALQAARFVDSSLADNPRLPEYFNEH
ncbi:phage protein [Cryptobacterium sp. CAG:338]|jgi:hypothetical protein|nr:phage protein [Cryptobacterium sp. CAG:338]